MNNKISWIIDLLKIEYKRFKNQNKKSRIYKAIIDKLSIAELEELE